MKWSSMVNGIPMEQLTKEQKEEFQRSVIKKIEQFGFKVHTVSSEKYKVEEKIKQSEAGE